MDNRNIYRAGMVFAFCLAVVVLFPEKMVPDSLLQLKFAIDSPEIFVLMPGAAIGRAVSGSGFDLLLRAAVALLCFDSGRRLAGPAPGLLAGIMSLFFHSDGEQHLFSFFIMVFADFSLWRLGRESGANAAVAGGLIGAAFLVRSAALPLPFVYSFWEFFFTKGPAGRRFARAAVILAGPFLALGAWNALSYLILGRFVFFEADRAGQNLVSGALGAVLNIQGDYYALAGAAKGSSLFLWAAGHIAAHPSVYALSVLKRGAVFLSEHPLPAAGAVLGLVLAPRKRPALLVAMLAATYVVSHLLVSIETRYFTPAAMLLCVLSGVPGGSLKFRAPGGAWCDKLLKSLAAVSIFWVVCVNAIILRAAAALRPRDAVVGEQVRSGTANPRILELAADGCFGRREVEEGYKLLAKAAENGSVFSGKLLGIIKGDGNARLSSESETDNLPAVQIFRALELNKAGEAAARLRTFEENLRNVRSADPGIYERLKRIAVLKPREPGLSRALQYWPDEKHRMLLSRLNPLMPLRGELALKFIFAPGGAKPGGPKALFWAYGRDGTPKSELDVFVEMMLAVKNGVPGEAEEIFDRERELVLSSKEGGRRLLTAGLLSGSEKLVLAGLSAAGLAPGKVSEVGGLFAKKRGGAAVCAAMKALSATGEWNRVFADISCRQSALGLPERAISTALCGLEAGESAEDALLLAVALQDAGEPGRAAVIMDRLAAAHPGEARYLSYAGAAKFSSGDLTVAKARFAAALRLDAGDRTALTGLKAVSAAGPR